VADRDALPLWERIVARILPISADRTPEDPDYIMPAYEEDRLDVLVMGLRGKDDPDGGLLTDSMMLLSFDKATKKTALVSIPRDLYVKVTDAKKDKINAALEELGMAGTKKLVSKITGLYVDNIVVFDFASFEKIINEIGGIDITLEQPFQETTQWGFTFSLPAGPNHLDGKTALTYVRSRFSSSDFDRARRQQQVILAIKKKIGDTKLLSDPVKVLRLVTALRSDIRTDVDLLDIGGLLRLARELSASADGMERFILSTENLLYESHEKGVYIILPKGDTFAQLKEFFSDILG
jgi:LCP family protein required for cell wall assembly